MLGSNTMPPEFPREHRDYIEDMTGCIPLLLRSLSQFKKENEFDESRLFGLQGTFEPLKKLFSSAMFYPFQAHKLLLIAL